MSIDIEPLLVEDREMHPDTGSAAGFDQARAWLRTCLTEHEHCRSIDSTFCPTRLLRIGGHGESLSLRLATDIPPGTQYATLSHCWGDTVTGQLTTENIQALTETIPRGFLGKTFHDAANIALELGLHFIWIDRLCIIQNSPEDWRSESVKMSLVYGNSKCNICATTASNISEGCFRANDCETLKPVKLTFPGKKDRGKAEGEEPNQKEAVSMYLTDAVHWWQRFQKEPLNRRAWVIQERILSPRNIHYDRDQIVWECNDFLASGRFPKGFGLLLHQRTKPLRVPLDSALRNAQEQNIPGQALHEIWRPVVGAFTSAGITKPTDRLIALHGVGTRIQEVCSWPYVAGMFLNNLQSQLCWAAVGDVKLQRPEIPIAPSWSWASVTGPIDMMPQWDLVDSDRNGEGPKAEDLKEEYLCQITGVERGTSAAETSGHVSTAELRISCYMVPARLSHPKEIRPKRLRRHAARLQKRRPYNDHRLKTRPLWPKFKFTPKTSSRAKSTAPEVEVKITWDVWDELTPAIARDLWFMPVYKMQEFANWQISTSYRKYQAVQGLILRAHKHETGRTIFCRCGTFTIDKGWRDFWEQALKFVSIDGVDLLPQDGVLVPEVDEKDCRRFTKQDGVLQYQISVK